MKIKNWLLDWDGTLVSSSAAHEEAFIKTITGLNEDIRNKFDYSRLAGAKTEDVFKALGIKDKDQINNLSRKKRNFYLDAVNEGKVQLYPGALDLLKTLKKKNAAIFIVTGASENAFYKIAKRENIESFFSGVITGNDVPIGKPDPAGYALALSRFELAPEESLAVEDAISGIMAAKTCGLCAIGVHQTEIQDQCEYWFENLEKLKGWITTSDEL